MTNRIICTIPSLSRHPEEQYDRLKEGRRGLWARWGSVSHAVLPPFPPSPDVDRVKEENGALQENIEELSRSSVSRGLLVARPPVAWTLSLSPVFCRYLPSRNKSDEIRKTSAFVN